MKDNAAQTEMTNPPSGESRLSNNPVDVQMAREAGSSQPKRTVKAKVVTGIYVGGQIYNPGSEVMLTEEEAVEFCDRKFQGPHSHEGEQSKPSRHIIVRAHRVV